MVRRGRSLLRRYFATAAACMLLLLLQVDNDVVLRNDVPEGMVVWADSGRVIQVWRQPSR
jgi:hypothetical protein